MKVYKYKFCIAIVYVLLKNFLLTIIINEFWKFKLLL